MLIVVSGKFVGNFLLCFGMIVLMLLVRGVCWF